MSAGFLCFFAVLHNAVCGHIRFVNCYFVLDKLGLFCKVITVII